MLLSEAKDQFNKNQEDLLAECIVLIDETVKQKVMDQELAIATLLYEYTAFLQQDSTVSDDIKVNMISDLSKSIKNFYRRTNLH